MRWLKWIAVVVVIVAVAGFFYVQKRLGQSLGPDAEELARLSAEVAAQNEAAFDQPAPEPAVYPEPGTNRNVYFGEMHIHTNLSFDAYIFGNRLGLDDAYDMARGKPVQNLIGETMQLSRPLDFVAITDHAEGFGLHEGCARSDITKEAAQLCQDIESPSARLFLKLRRDGEKRPPVSTLPMWTGNAEDGQMLANSTWAKIKEAADRHYEPGKFTTFAAYEYSPPLPDSGKHHRNIIFRGSETPDYAVSAYHAPSELELWQQLETTCTGACRFLTIPHNPNKSWGLEFAGRTIDGVVYTEEDWLMRERNEPIVEMFQIKGNSECVIGFGTTDEECGFEQFFPVCAEGQETLCIQETSMIRDGLKKGLLLEDEVGVNPLAFGLIGATDNHNANPGDTEEWDWRGPSGLMTSPASKRLSAGPGGGRGTLKRNPGGLAAVWAEENTREALFDAMMRKEVYATSGTRIKLRFFGGAGLGEESLEGGDAIAAAYRDGVPMGGRLLAVDGAPQFLIWAVADLMSAPLDRVQVIKGWAKDGQSFEEVYDVICADGRTPDATSHRCPATEATVDLSNCSVSEDVGANELKTLWSDPTFDASEKAFYYVRVIQNPTCRWSTYDALRLGQAPPEGLPATSTEMAWSSPIWVSPSGGEAVEELQ